jgi:hypothetical protein
MDRKALRRRSKRRLKWTRNKMGEGRGGRIELDYSYKESKNRWRKKEEGGKEVESGGWKIKKITRGGKVRKNQGLKLV